jgi:peptidoglycan hydrolase-like protein with peptidoglycan-binding domain
MSEVKRGGARRALFASGVGVLLVGAGTAAAVGFGGRDPAPAATSDLPPATATVSRGTLTQTEQVSGTLGYGDVATISAHAAGTVTWLPATGATVSRGQPVYRVDDKPVPLLYGTLPFYRPLTDGVSGADVKEFEQNLAALGYTGFTVDDDYTANTATAVRKWQEGLGLTQTGTVDPAQVALAPDAIRVSARHATLGSTASGPVLDYTGTTRTVSVDLDVAKEGLVQPGIAATVTLPSGATVDGTVASIGTVATAGANGGNSTLPVSVTVADQSKLGSLDGAPVDVTLVSAQARNVLSVPVAALVALAEGGYGVQVIDGSSTRYVAVQTGMFANGRVEITGDGIAAGTVVGVPK